MLYPMGCEPDQFCQFCSKSEPGIKTVRQEYDFYCDRLNELRFSFMALEVRYKTAQGVDYDKIPSDHNGSDRDSALMYVVEKDEILGEIREVKRLKGDAKKRFLREIDKRIKDPKMRQMARMRYIDHLKTKELENNLPYSKRTICYKLKTIKKLLEI